MFSAERPHFSFLIFFAYDLRSSCFAALNEFHFPFSLFQITIFPIRINMYFSSKMEKNMPGHMVYIASTRCIGHEFELNSFIAIDCS